MPIFSLFKTLAGYTVNTAFFISRRMISRKRDNPTLSGPIIRIATAGVALGVGVMLLSVAVVSGFQHEIRNKVIGFGSHIQITNYSANNLSDLEPITVNQPFYPWLDTLEGVRHIQPFVIKQAILETPKDIEGVLVKGIDANYDWEFFADKLVSGKLLDTQSHEPAFEVLISAFQSKRLQLDTAGLVAVYFIDEQGEIRQRNFKIAGIYETGFEELDRQFIYTDIRILQRISNWGIQAQMRFLGCRDDSAVVEAVAFGARDVYRYEWNVHGLKGPGPHSVCLAAHAQIQVVITDKWGTLPDTASLQFSSPESMPLVCRCDSLTPEPLLHTSGGSGKYYVAGFEVLLNRYEDLGKMDDAIYELIGYELRTSTIWQQNPEIFNWLEMLDINVVILLSLIIVVAVVNMTSALLILILERNRMIGMLKALGSTNWLIRKIFLYNAAYLIGIGILLGNALGIGLIWLQSNFGIFKLDPSSYYVSQVPVLIEPWQILALNAGVLIISLTVLILPTYLVTRISPVRAIRFD